LKVELKKRGEEDYEILINEQPVIYLSRAFETDKPNLTISREMFDEITIMLFERVRDLDEAKKKLENVGKGIGLKYEIVIGGFKTMTS